MISRSSQSCWRTTLSSLLLIPLLLLGCQYQLGSGSQRTFKNVALLPIQNDTMIPQTEAILDSQLRDQLLRAGIQVVSSERADAILEVRLTEFDREISAVRPDDFDLALGYGLTLRAEVTLTGRDGQTILDGIHVDISRETLALEGVQVAEYQTLPVMMRDLASRIRRRVIDQW